MKSFNYKITDENGIHARPAGLLVKTASKFESEITIKSGDKQADVKRIFSLMGMALKFGDEITVECSGSDEELASDAMKEILESSL